MRTPKTRFERVLDRYEGIRLQLPEREQCCFEVPDQILGLVLDGNNVQKGRARHWLEQRTVELWLGLAELRVTEFEMRLYTNGEPKQSLHKPCRDLYIRFYSEEDRLRSLIDGGLYEPAVLGATRLLAEYAEMVERAPAAIARLEALRLLTKRLIGELQTDVRRQFGELRELLSAGRWSEFNELAGSIEAICHSAGVRAEQQSEAGVSAPPQRQQNWWEPFRTTVVERLGDVLGQAQE